MASSFGYIYNQKRGDLGIFNGVEWVPRSLSEYAALINALLDHGTLLGLSDDDHVQYPLLAGRSGGQQLVGGTGTGEKLTLKGNSFSGSDAEVEVLSTAAGATGALLAMYHNSASPAISDFSALKTYANDANGSKTQIGTFFTEILAVTAAAMSSRQKLGVLGAGTFQLVSLDGVSMALYPDTTSSLDLGLTGNRWKSLWVSAGGITTSGSVEAAQYTINSADLITKPSGNQIRLTWDSNDYVEYDKPNNRHGFFVASTEMFRIGATASEYKSYSARATNASGTQTIAAATVVAVTFATEDYDTGAIHDTGSNTSRMTAPVTGRYHVSGGIFWAAEALSTTTLLLVRLSLNGTPIPGARSYFPPISSIATNSQAQSIDCDVVLTAGQYVEMEVFFDAGASSRTLTLANCALSMHYIGGL